MVSTRSKKATGAGAEAEPLSPAPPPTTRKSSKQQQQQQQQQQSTPSPPSPPPSNEAAAGSSSGRSPTPPTAAHAAHAAPHDVSPLLTFTHLEDSVDVAAMWKCLEQPKGPLGRLRLWLRSKAMLVLINTGMCVLNGTERVLLALIIIILLALAVDGMYKQGFKLVNYVQPLLQEHGGVAGVIRKLSSSTQ